jgi:hypothetical protein
MANPKWFASEDFESERGESLQRGLSTQLWPICDAYFLEGGIIKAKGHHRLYFPLARPRLPFDLAKVPDGDKDAALAFVRNWGHLGHFAVVDPKKRRDGDPLSFIWGHAYTVRNVLTLFKALQSEKPDVLDQALDKIVSLRPLTNNSPNTYPSWLWMARSREGISFELLDQTPEEFALKIISNSIAKNLEGTSPAIEIEPDAPGQPPASPLSRLRFSFRWNALVEVAYWHLAGVVTAGRRIARCKECGGFFEQTDRRQEFCPPSEEEIIQARQGARSRAQSRCALRYRVRQQRQKAQTQSQADAV